MPQGKRYGISQSGTDAMRWRIWDGWPGFYEKIMGKSTINGCFLCDCFMRFDGTYIMGLSWDLIQFNGIWWENIGKSITYRGSSSEVNHLGFADDLYFLNQKTTTWGICREYVHKQIQALDDGWWVWKWEVDPPNGQASCFWCSYFIFRQSHMLKSEDFIPLVSISRLFTSLPGEITIVFTVGSGVTRGANWSRLCHLLKGRSLRFVLSTPTFLLWGGPKIVIFHDISQQIKRINIVPVKS